MNLTGKTILLISPQSWQGLFVSKHHYAIELAKKGNKVYFLEPPRDEAWSITPTSYEGILVIRYPLPKAIKGLRFHIRWVFDLFMKRYANSIIRRTGELDIVWCFEPNLFKDLRWFNAEFRLYHPVDNLIEKKHQLAVGMSADLIVSVAPNILDLFPNTVPKAFVNHGVAENFLNAGVLNATTDQLRFAYIGNLLIKGLDIVQLSKVIENHPDLQFDFFGIQDKSKAHSKHQVYTFIEFLEKQPNVNLCGLKKPNDLAKLLGNYNGYLICYNPSIEINSGSNSHKMLEYLAMGKVIVSSYLSVYKEHEGLIPMSHSNTNSDYCDIFSEVISNLDYWNSIEKQKLRRQLAESNSYPNQVEKIEKLIGDIQSSN